MNQLKSAIVETFWSVFKIVTSRRNTNLAHFCFLKCKFKTRMLRNEKFKKLIGILFKFKKKYQKTEADLTISFHENTSISYSYSPQKELR